MRDEQCKKMHMFGRCTGKMLKMGADEYICSACAHREPCILNTVHERHPEATRQCRHFDDKET